MCCLRLFVWEWVSDNMGPTATPSAAPYSSVPAAPTAVPSYAPSYAPPEIPYSAPTAPYASAQFGSILQSADPPSVAYAPSFGPPGGVLPSSLPAQLQVPYEEESPRPYQEVQLIRIPEPRAPAGWSHGGKVCPASLVCY